jgi:hypothetical protein
MPRPGEKCNTGKLNFTNLIGVILYRISIPHCFDAPALPPKAFFRPVMMA